MRIPFFALLVLNSLIYGMDPAIISPKSTPQGMKLREMVIAHLQENERKQVAAEPVKDAKYYEKELSSSQRNLVNIPPNLIRDEVLKGPLCLKESTPIGVLCAAHMVFIINLLNHKIKTINIPSKMESSDTHRPTPCAVEYAKIFGIKDEQVLLGELDGRVLIADPASYSVKTFGYVPGRILEFFIHPKGEKIAVKYESKDDANKSIPCFAVAASYALKAGALNLSMRSLAPNLAQSALDKRRSWAPPLNESGGLKSWSHFAVQTCNHEVKNITFEEDYCVTHCATGNIEKWELQNLDTDPKLVKVGQIEQRQP